MFCLVKRYQCFIIYQCTLINLEVHDPVKLVNTAYGYYFINQYFGIKITFIYDGGWFQGGKWHCVHMDELRSPNIPMPSLAQLQSNSPAQLLSAVMTNQLAEDITQQDRSLHPDLVRHLFQNCVQMVVSCIQDTDDDSERAMQRISLLLHFFQDPGP